MIRMMSGSRRTAKDGPSMENSSGKKTKLAAEPTPAKITVTVDPKLLECCVCFCPLVPPIFQCSNGHITCSGCCNHLDYECDKCIDPTTASRCRAVERLVAGLTMPCQFKEQGCSEMVPYSEKPEHEESCPHAPCYCPFAGCRPYSGVSLLGHIYKEHPEIRRTAVTGGSAPVKLQAGEAGRLLYLGGRGRGGRAGVFLLLVDDWSAPSGRSLSVVRLMDEPFEEDDFKYKIQVYARNGVLTLAGDTQSVGRMTTTKADQVGGASLFVPNAMWSLHDSPVYVELR